MQDMPKQVIIGSIAVAGAVAVAAVADLFVGVPFSGSSHTQLMDILFVVASAIVVYLGIDAYRDLS